MSFTKNISAILKETLLGYVAWTCVHWTCSNLYVSLCTPYTGIGFLKSFYLVQSPHCSAINWLGHISMTNVKDMFAVCSMWCMLRILSMTSNFDKNTIKTGHPISP